MPHGHLPDARHGTSGRPRAQRTPGRALLTALLDELAAPPVDIDRVLDDQLADCPEVRPSG